MTTSNSPIHKLREQAERIANRLKALERGENIPGLMPLRKLEKIKIGLVQDDKITQVEFTWERINPLRHNFSLCWNMYMSCHYIFIWEIKEKLVA
mgnify:CR=1 FL=1